MHMDRRDCGNQESQNVGQTRRTFLKGAGSALAAGAAARVTAGAGAAMAGEAETWWDYECDVVVVGAGTGLTGALAAAVDGCDVIVLECAGITGGTMAASGGVSYVPCNSCEAAEGIEDTREMARTYLMACAEGQASDEIIDAHLIVRQRWPTSCRSTAP